jgi:hypothetical protein
MANALKIYDGEAENKLAEQLERGDVVFYPTCPFALPTGDDLRFLLDQRLGNAAHKNISYDPNTDKSSGYRRQNRTQAERLHALLSDFSCVVTRWMCGVLPRYAECWKMDRVSYRPEEEATRKLRQTARNDLLHVDSFPSRPTNGHRIFRVFANINPVEPRVWVTSDNFAQLLARYGKQAGLPISNVPTFGGWLRRTMMRVFRPSKQARSTYDEFMLRFHNFLKANDAFQERCFKRYWSFPPNSAWMVMTDAASHAVLRGRYALEHSYFVAPESLALPEESPPALLERASGIPVLVKKAA